MYSAYMSVWRYLLQRQLAHFGTHTSLHVQSKYVCVSIISPMEINSKCMHGLIVLAQTVLFPLKLSMLEVFPGLRTNYSQPSGVPRAKVIM